jgi:flagellar basal body-associated protein FliL
VTTVRPTYPGGPDGGLRVILLVVLLVALAVTVVVYPLARIIGERRHRQGEPTWWSLKLHSGDREAALAEDRARYAARQANRARRRAGLGRLLGRDGDGGPHDGPAAG